MEMSVKQKYKAAKVAIRSLRDNECGDATLFKEFVKSADVETWNKYRSKVVSDFCYGNVDDPSILDMLMEKGARFYLEWVDFLHTPNLLEAVGNPKLLRKLLDFGSNPNSQNKDGSASLTHARTMYVLYANSPYKYARAISSLISSMKVLVDAGGKLNEYFPKCILDFEANRLRIRSTSIAILGSIKTNSKVIGENGKDVLKIIARCLWSLRGL